MRLKGGGKGRRKRKMGGEREKEINKINYAGDKITERESKIKCERQGREK